MKTRQTDIIFIRHGETDMNKANLYFGHLDPELNEVGKSQLKRTKSILEKSKENIDIVFSSDLKRCVESMEILEIDKEIEKILLKEFREINFGIFEGKTYNQLIEEFPEEIERMHKNWRKFKAKDGESLQDVMNRVTVKLKELIEKYRNKTLLIVSHAGVIKIIISYYLFGNLDGYWKVKVDNGSMTKMCITEDEFVYFDYINRI